MPRVLIHPSRRRGAVERNAARSLDVEVDFVGDPLLSEALRGDKALHESLLDVHPSGSARFWGTHAGNEARVEGLCRGDLVIFTGFWRVWGIGIVGHRFTSVDVGNALWPVEAGFPPYEIVYSLQSLDVGIDFSTEIVNAALGYVEKYPMRSPNIFSGEQALDLMDAIRGASPTTFPEGHEEAVAIETIDRLMEQAELGSRRLGVPVNRTLGTVYQRAAKQVTLTRAEHQLVYAYVGQLPESAVASIARGAGRETDLLVADDGRLELIEAKSSTSRNHIRQAVGQILDYAPSLEPVPDRAAILLPHRPDRSAADYIARYGIDCIFLESEGDGFARIDASPGSRARMSAFWR